MKTVRVMVVDDNEDHRFFITRGLDAVEGVRLEISVAKDGLEALEMLRGDSDTPAIARPHFILLDLRMPRMDGLGVLDALAKDEQLRQIPVCVLTSSDREEDIREAYARGTNSYVVKASNMARITDELRAIAEYWVQLNRLPETVP